jgi:hypothetical protein
MRKAVASDQWPVASDQWPVASGQFGHSEHSDQETMSEPVSDP